jgi:endonuclease/exonuclease/phosphatase family metal-dependent hydrolase
MPRLKVLAVLAAVAALAAPAAKANDATNQDHRGVTVMTQNLYLGADLNPIFAAPTPFALFAAVGAAWNSVQANDFPSRAQAVADEIAAARPDLVGLQEATLYRTDVPPDGTATPAETVAYVYVQLLVDALAERGLDYEWVSVFTGTDAELPAGLPPQLDVRITDRVVVLARASGGPTVHVSNPQSGSYAAALTVPTAGGPITLPRGWASVDVKVRGDRFRFVSTHLEAFSPLIRNPQAAQLVSGPLATDLPVVVVCWSVHLLPRVEPAPRGPGALEADRPCADARRLQHCGGRRRGRGARRPDSLRPLAFGPRRRRRDAAASLIHTLRPGRLARPEAPLRVLRNGRLALARRNRRDGQVDAERRARSFA